MATLVAGNGPAFNIDALHLGGLSGAAELVSPELVRVTLSGNRFVNFVGNFQFLNGSIADGILNSVTEESAGALVVGITSIDIPAVSITAALNARDSDGLRSIILGGADHMTGSASGDLLRAYAGTDFMLGAGGDDTLYGGVGDDSVYGQFGNDVQVGEQGNDVMDGGLGDDVLIAGQGNDALGGGPGADFVAGDAGDDYVLAGDDADIVNGGDGNDLLRGQPGDDTISGGDGNDMIWGDKGTNLVSGGAGADTFLFFSGAGTTRITDFSYAQGDRIAFQAGTPSYTVTDSGGNAVIDFGGGTQAFLVGVSAASVASDWILTL